MKGWTKTPDVAFVRRGILYDANEGRFTVTRQGLYMVYCHLAFRGVPSENAEHIYSQKIVRAKTYNGDTQTEDLIMNTELRNCGDTYKVVPCYSSTLFSQLRLRQGDQIYIETLSQELLVADAKASYFGMYMISF